MSRPPLYLQSLGTASAAGVGLDELRKTLFGDRPPAMRARTGLAPDRSQSYCCGLVPGLAAGSAESRTKQLIELCLDQMPGLKQTLQTFEPERIAVVLGACTSGMDRVEAAMAEHAASGRLPEDFRVRDLNLFEPARFAARAIGAKGPAYTVSNACASGLMALESAAQLLLAGLADAVLTGGCDGFCQFTNAGFCALSAVSAEPCHPFSRGRKGINLGEGGALMLMTKNPEGALMAYSGAGLTTDAHHLSAPEPQGLEAARAMRLALQTAGLEAADIDLVIAHGTGTPLNDSMEARAVHAVFGNRTPCASYKALSGHALAGAGALQAAAAAALLTGNPQGRLAASAGLLEKDPELAPAHILDHNEELGRPLNHILVNAFAFGGSNASAVFSRV